jgi:hypothetical protein
MAMAMAMAVAVAVDGGCAHGVTINERLMTR